jgi:hypothetical protein
MAQRVRIRVKKNGNHKAVRVRKARKKNRR